MVAEEGCSAVVAEEGCAAVAAAEGCAAVAGESGWELIRGCTAKWQQNSKWMCGRCDCQGAALLLGQPPRVGDIGSATRQPIG